MDDIYNNHYPDLPNDPSAGPKNSFFELDRISFEAWLKNEKIQTDLPILKAYLQNYCVSTFGGPPHDLSAAQVLNFLSADSQGVFVPEGGNSLITEHLYQDLKTSLPHDHLRPRTMVVNVDIVSNGKNKVVNVTYFNEKNELRTIEAKKVVITLPKFIAKKIVPCMPEKQKQAIDQLEYHPYLVANVILKKKMKSPAFDLFSYSEKLLISDIIFANWIKHDQGEHTILTLYRPFATKEARAELLPETSYAQQKKIFEVEIKKTFKIIFPKENLDQEILDIRITRWGHALPLAKPGMEKAGIFNDISKNIEGQIFFVNQDNMMSPCFENCFQTALHCANEIG